MAGGLLGVAVTAMLTGAASPAPRAGATTPTARPAAQTIHHVTLITGTSTLTLDLTASRDPKLWTTSTTTHTVWTVKSSPSSGDNNTLSVLQIAYQVTTDLAGNRAGGVQALSLQPYHLDGAVGAGTVGTPKFEVSFNDGTTWVRVPVVKVGGSYLAIFTAPMSGFVSLRTTASDSKGNAVTQTVIRAYGLSKN
jgi:hypothetical protein